MVLTLDWLRMESSFTTASCQRGEPLSLQVHTHWYSCFSAHSWSISFSCSSCTSRFNCNWCPVEFQCRTSGADCSQSPVVSAHAALAQCYVHLHSGASVCPPIYNYLFPSTSFHDHPSLHLSSVHLLILSPSPACLEWWWQVLPSWRTGTTGWVPCTEGREPTDGCEWPHLLQGFKSNNNNNKFPYFNSSLDCRFLLLLCHLQHWQWVNVLIPHPV